jgi:hypothetical protein
MSESVLYRLAIVAEKERRDPRQQAAYILEHALRIAEEPQIETTDGAGCPQGAARGHNAKNGAGVRQDTANAVLP